MLAVCCVDHEWLTRKLRTGGRSQFFRINDNFEACLNITGRQITIFGAVFWNYLPHNKLCLD